MALYMAPISSLEQMKHATPEQKQEKMDMWKVWGEAYKGAIVDRGALLGRTKSASPTYVVDTKNEVCGYTIVQADSHDAAAKIFEGHPHFSMQGATIDVLECVDMSDEK